jgi:hypothetical protein
MKSIRLIAHANRLAGELIIEEEKAKAENQRRSRRSFSPGEISWKSKDTHAFPDLYLDYYLPCSWLFEPTPEQDFQPEFLVYS